MYILYINYRSQIINQLKCTNNFHSAYQSMQILKVWQDLLTGVEWADCVGEVWSRKFHVKVKYQNTVTNYSPQNKIKKKTKRNISTSSIFLLVA